ncbi:CHAT domain-containing protein [Nostoc punctiforme FACHB-252]|uniref:CHAT domain-containing protein n=1 Tax=Nostoc punctiforme FACHB-252 TaxID=1357509 RepID=A0ABR8H777_NOSPU|nr:CHAT domain-containing protein [Nostoc punctiforme]MBD2611598.1 CHAT domain-containing protein [Nostoc punctiforme FACHB-252]
MKKQYKNAKLFLTFLALFTVIFTSSLSLLSFQLPVAIAQSNTKAEADRLRQQGEKQLEAGQYTQGTESLEQAMMIYRRIRDTESAKNIVDRLYLIYYTRGAYDKLKKLQPIFTELNPNAEQTKTELEPQVTEEKEKSAPQFELNPQVEELIAQGFLQQSKQDYVGAKAYFEQAFSQAKAIGKEPEKIAALKALGTFYLYQGDYINALANLEPAEHLSAARYQATEKESASGDIQKMSNYFLEILYHRLPILFLIGETYLQQKNPSKALTYFQEADKIVSKIDKDYKNSFQFYNSKFVYSSLYTSRAYYSLGKYDLALSHARKAIEEAKSPNNFTNPFGDLLTSPVLDLGDGHGHVLAGIALEKLGKLEQAEKELRQAIQIFETNRKTSASQANIHNNLDLFDNQVRATYHLQRVLLAQNKSEEALAASEWGRGRILVEAATAPRELTLKEKVDAFVDTQYTSESICKEQESLHPEVNVPKGMEHIFVSSKFECDGEALIQELKKSYLEEAQKSPEMLDYLTATTPTNTAPSNIQPLKVEQLKQIAQSHQATIVEYSIISETTFFHPGYLSLVNYGVNRNAFPGEEKKLVIWVIKPTGEIKFRQIDLKNQKIPIKDLVTNTRKTMGLDRSIGVFLKPDTELPDGSTRNASEVQAKEKLKQLHELLIEPIADLLPSNPEAKVVFVPHKELFLVPFAALIDSKDKYLIEQHTIITAPSIQALDVTRQKRQKQTGKSKLAVVVGNPTMPTIKRPNNQTPTQLSNLPGAEREGKAVAQLLNAEFLTGNKATKAEVLKQLPNARYIHLATHGLLEDFASFGIPGAVALAPSNQDNGLLTSSEIQELNLQAELAVLSACDTGGGDITGDGVVGLSRALIVAGVPSIVVSLWSVPDAPTAELMGEFYRNFQERKLDKAQALRQAMLETMKTHPNLVDWAGFTLIGQSK